jgi:ribulose-phosphate 3-epimerase
MHYIAPSILAADFAFLHKDILMLNESKADFIHVDIMDGLFVPNFSFGFPVLEVLNKYSSKLLDVHLMIQQPERYIEQFRQSGAHIITVHLEACPHLHRTIQQIKQTGAKVGVALNPHTPVTALFDILEDIDLVCLMSVNAGFGGQKFIYNTLNKIRLLKEEIITRNLEVLIEIDGGVGFQNAVNILSAGADILVAGTAVFAADNPIKAIDDFKQIYINYL